MADDAVGGSFDAVGVVSGAFEGAGAGAGPAFGQRVTLDFGVGLGYRFGQVFRGKWPPGR
jgi:hypothetical protein